ncbi:hypothetical protein [Streptomyces sp. NPDC058157]|uniref:hypothetical protein n=1 Tax=Streptomyces sp. NPDC058157 TaxID=3346360 RepID=UPI0036EA8F92
MASAASYAVAADVRIGGVTGGHVDCFPTEAMTAVLKERGINLEAVAPADALSGGGVRFDELSGSMSSTFQGKLDMKGGISLAGKDGTRLNVLELSGETPLGAMSATPETARAGQAAQKGPRAEVAYPLAPGTVGGRPTGLTTFEVTVGATDFALKEAGATRINDAFGTTLAKDATFMKCTAELRGSLG